MTKLVINEVVAKAVISCLAISSFYITERLIAKELSRRLMLVGSDSCCAERNERKGRRRELLACGGDVIPTTLSSQSVRDHEGERNVVDLFIFGVNSTLSNFN